MPSFTHSAQGRFPGKLVANNQGAIRSNSSVLRGGPSTRRREHDRGPPARGEITVAQVERKQPLTHPAPPFTTSTLRKTPPEKWIQRAKDHGVAPAAACTNGLSNIGEGQAVHHLYAHRLASIWLRRPWPNSRRDRAALRAGKVLRELEFNKTKSKKRAGSARTHQPTPESFCRPDIEKTNWRRCQFAVFPGFGTAHRGLARCAAIFDTVRVDSCSRVRGAKTSAGVRAKTVDLGVKPG